MKNKISFVMGGLLALNLVVMTSAQAANRAANTEKSITISRSAPEYSSSNIKFGLGLSNMVTATVGVPGISAMLELTPVHSLQLIFGIGRTAGGVLLGTGIYYRANVLGSQATGLHVGGGLQTGTTGAAYFMISPLAGLHMCAGQNNAVCFGVDMGLSLQVTPEPVNLALGGSPNLMGLNVHYMF